MFDTHCHLNFKAFDGKVEEVVERARKAGVNYFVVPGTDVETSKKAIEIAEKFNGIYAAVGIHPHHVFGSARQFLSHESLTPLNEIKKIEELLTNKKVVAVGEVGLDKHIYKKTKYQDYKVYPEFIEGQKEFLKAQIELAVKYKKSLILHNRQTKTDLLKIIVEPAVAKDLAGKAVFHCCEPDIELLEFAKRHKIYIGVDGDVTYWKEKQNFVKKIPLEQLVLETDSPFLSPKPLRSETNEPKNLDLIASFIAKQVNITKDKLIKITKENSKKLFQIDLKT